MRDAKKRGTSREESSARRDAGKATSEEFAQGVLEEDAEQSELEDLEEEGEEEDVFDEDVVRDGDEEEEDDPENDDHPDYQLATADRPPRSSEDAKLESLQRELLALKRRVHASEEQRRPRSSSRTGSGGERNTGFLTHQRVALFVDVQNMYHSAKKVYGRNLSYAKLLDYAVRGRQLIRARAYVIDRQGVDQEAFIEHLRSTGFHVKRKELVERPDGSRKGNWDLGLAIDAMNSAPKVDVIILVTGDGDFLPLVRALTIQGVSVEVACFGESASEALTSAADHLHFLGKNQLY